MFLVNFLVYHFLVSEFWNAILKSQILFHANSQLYSSSEHLEFLTFMRFWKRTAERTGWKFRYSWFHKRASFSCLFKMFNKYEFRSIFSPWNKVFKQEFFLEKFKNSFGKNSLKFRWKLPTYSLGSENILNLLDSLICFIKSFFQFFILTLHSKQIWILSYIVSCQALFTTIAKKAIVHGTWTT